MPIPLLPAIAGGSFILKKLFGGKRPELKTPEYFGPDYQNTLAALTQAREAQYGSGLNDIREALANAGTLTPASLVDTTTRFGVAKGADIAGVQGELRMNELAGKRESEIMKNKANYEADVNARNQQLDLVTQLGAAGGSLLAKGKAGGGGADINSNDEYINVGTELAPQYIRNPNYVGGAHKILRALFGF